MSRLSVRYKFYTFAENFLFHIFCVLYTFIGQGNFFLHFCFSVSYYPIYNKINLQLTVYEKLKDYDKDML